MLRFLLEIFWQAFILSVSWMGTSPLNIAVKIIIVPLAVFLVKLRRQGWNVMWQRIIANVKDTAIATAIVWTILIGFNMFYSVPHRINDEAKKVFIPHPSKVVIPSNKSGISVRSQVSHYSMEPVPILERGGIIMAPFYLDEKLTCGKVWFIVIR